MAVSTDLPATEPAERPVSTRSISWRQPALAAETRHEIDKSLREFIEKPSVGKLFLNESFGCERARVLLATSTSRYVYVAKGRAAVHLGAGVGVVIKRLAAGCRQTTYYVGNPNAPLVQACFDDDRLRDAALVLCRNQFSHQLDQIVGEQWVK